jgi:hypothetical protein
MKLPEVATNRGKQALEVQVWRKAAGHEVLSTAKGPVDL